MTTAIDDSSRQAPGAQFGTRERWVIGLISIGHFLSHFYALTLPPLFPILKAEFGVSYVELGFAMMAYGLLGGVVQAPIGFLVDNLGPRKVLLCGLGLNATAILAMGFTGEYWMLLVFAVFAGLGNSVFHPADYAILSNRIHNDRLGRAFSIHTFSGFLGGACAPVAILAIAAISGWRSALIMAGLVGLGALALLAARYDVLGGGAEKEAPDTASADGQAGGPASGPSGLRLLFTAPILLFLGFNILYGMSTGGLLAFTVSGLINLHDLEIDLASAALTGHLFGVVGGILLTGMIVDKFPRHLVTATVAMLLVTLTTMLVAFSPASPPLLIALMVASGFGLGAVLPPRDLIIRAVIPPGDTGKVFGFVFVGFSIGISGAAILLGWLLDQGMPGMIFIISGLVATLALITLAAAHTLAQRTLKIQTGN